IFHDGGIVGGDEVVEHLRAAAGAHTAGAEDVLVGDGYSAQGGGVTPGQPGVGGGGLVQGNVGRDGDVTVIQAVQALDALQIVPGQLHAGKVLAAQPLHQLGNGFVVHWEVFPRVIPVADRVRRRH